MSGTVALAVRHGGWSVLGWLGSALLLLQAQLQFDNDWAWPLLAVAWVPWGLVLPRNAWACWLEGAALLMVAGLPFIMGAASAIGLQPSLTALLLLSLGLSLPFGLARPLLRRALPAVTTPPAVRPAGQAAVLAVGLAGFWLFDQLKNFTVANWISYADPLGEGQLVAPVLRWLGAEGAGGLLLVGNVLCVLALGNWRGGGRGPQPLSGGQGGAVPSVSGRGRWLALVAGLVGLAVAALPLGCALLPDSRTAAGRVPSLSLALLAPLDEQTLEQLSETAVAEQLLATYRQLDPAEVGLAILPQSGLAGLALEEGPVLRELLLTVAGHGIPLLAGAYPPAAPVPGALRTTYNSGVLITPTLARRLLAQGQVEWTQLPWQHKRHLVPVGEYDPFWLQGWLGRALGGHGLSRLHVMLPGMSSLPLRLPLALPRGGWSGGEELRLGVMLCYDTYFPAVTRSLRAEGAELLIVLSSDLAFRGSALSRQGLRTARLRGMESGLAVVRIAWSPAGSGVYSAAGEALPPAAVAGGLPGVLRYDLPLGRY